MPQDIYSKAGADAAFVHDSPEGRQALAESPEVKATTLPRRSARTDGVHVFGGGTSYTNGAGAAPGESFFDRAAADAGATSTTNNGQGRSTTCSLPAQYVDGQPNGAWVPGTSEGLVFLEVGIGEALEEDDASWLGHRNVFENKLLTAIRWFRSRLNRKLNHPSVVVTGGVFETLTALSAVRLEPGVKLVANGATVTITLDEDADAELVVFTVPWMATADATNNGDFRYRVDGGPWRNASTKGNGDPRPDGANAVLTLSSVRIPDARRDSVIEIEKTGGAELWFHSYALMGNPTPPPIILIQDVHLNEVDGAWVFPAGVHTPGPRRNNATLDVYRAIVERVAASPEFGDGLIAVADPNPRFDPTTMLDVDQVHLNPTGHEVYRRAIADARQRIVYRP